ncbi:ferredoxin [Rhodococcus aetherivorans]|uniref:ferredoxin n=2 Tax=Nocardiaceae TaxID=85025 RepID=UPI00366246EA
MCQWLPFFRRSISASAASGRVRRGTPKSPASAGTSGERAGGSSPLRVDKLGKVGETPPCSIKICMQNCRSLEREGRHSRPHPPRGAPMKVRVDEGRCQGHTLCAMASPDVFLLRDDDGHAFVDETAVTPDRYDAIRDAQATCPERAVEITES